MQADRWLEAEFSPLEGLGLSPPPTYPDFAVLARPERTLADRPSPRYARAHEPAAAEDENPDALLRALAEVAKARGMTQVARDAGLGRESLYKALAPGSHPRFETINAILRAVARVAKTVKVKKTGSKTAAALSRARKRLKRVETSLGG